MANPNDSGCARFLDQLDDRIDGSLGADALQTFDAHVRACTSCAVALANRRLIIEALRLGAAVKLATPDELDARVSNVGNREAFVQHALTHWGEPASTPNELDGRVLVCAKNFTSPARFIAIRRARTSRRIVYAAAASIMLTLGATVIYKSIDHHPARFSEVPFKLVKVPSDKLSNVLLNQALPLSGLTAR
ncbi:MAG: zf-HC2 domain-containing protein [Planctomycetes bacterium]|nr:zf-HC2 domain-containing protein [Planctomycetota bacterium]